MFENIKIMLSGNLGKLAFLLVFIPFCSIIGFMPYYDWAYYLILLSVLVYGFVSSRSVSIDIWMLMIMVAALLSLFWGNPPAIFKSWERFVFFIVVISVISPLITNHSFIRIRVLAFQWVLYLACFIAISSFFCYFLGINYMRHYSIDNTAAGWFGGITVNSMILGPISTISTIYLLWLYFRKKNLQTRIKRILLLGGFFCSFCSVLLTASRGSFVAVLVGIISVLYFSFRRNLMKLLRIFFLASLIMAVGFPIYAPLAKNLVIKQSANIESGGTFSSRSSKWGNRIAEIKSSPIFGIGFASVDSHNVGDYDGRTIEPGSSWLGVLSMTGMIGGISVLGLITRCYVFLSRRIKCYESILLLSLLNTLIVHMMSEGYIFAAGSVLFFVFWLLVGVISVIK